MSIKEIVKELKTKYGSNELIKDELKMLSKGRTNLRFLAETVIEATEDLGLAKEIYKCALDESAESISDTLSIIFSIACILNDKEWTSNLTHKILDDITNTTHFVQLAEIIARLDGLDDKRWALEIYEKAVEMASSTRDYTTIARSVYNDRYIGDEVFATKMLEKAVTSAEDVWDICSVADLVASKKEYSGNKKWAKQILEDSLVKFTLEGNFDSLKSKLAEIDKL